MKPSIMLLHLEPFGIVHMEALERIQSPFLAGDSLPSYQDLIKAVLICAHPANKITGLDGLWFRFKLRIWLRRARRLDWSAEILKLQAYILAGLRQLLVDVRAELAEKEASI